MPVRVATSAEYKSQPVPMSRVAGTTWLSYNGAMKLLISLLGLAGWVAWGYTVIFLDPSAHVAPIAFYASLFVALTCSLSRLQSGGDPAGWGFRHGSVNSLSHAAIVSMLLLFALWLQSLRMLTSLHGILLASMFLMIELGFFLTGGQRARARRRPRRVPMPDMDEAPLAAGGAGRSPRR